MLGQRADAENCRTKYEMEAEEADNESVGSNSHVEAAEEELPVLQPATAAARPGLTGGGAERLLSVGWSKASCYPGKL